MRTQVPGSLKKAPAPLAVHQAEVPEPLATHQPLGVGELLTDAAATQYLGLAPGTLAVWRSTKRYPIPCLRLGSKIKREDVYEHVGLR